MTTETTVTVSKDELDGLLAVAHSQYARHSRGNVDFHNRAARIATPNDNGTYTMSTENHAWLQSWSQPVK